MRVLFPDVVIFRPDPSINHWISCIDDFVVSECLVKNVRVSDIKAVPCT